MRTLLLPALIAAGVGLVQAATPAIRTIYLDTPGAFEALERDNPAHYRKVVEMIQIAGEVSCEKLPQLFKVQFAASAARCHNMLVLTSDPPKRHLWFVLEDTGYVTNVVLRAAPAKAIPAK